MATDQKSRLSERYARVWDLLASIAAADTCACDYPDADVVLIRHIIVCFRCAAQEALRSLAASALDKAVARTDWREMMKAIAELENRGL